MFRRIFTTQKRFYDKKVIEHFQNTKNVGSFKKDEPNVGTGLVGAPACFHGDTKIATADGSRIKSLKELFDNFKEQAFPVWSYNISLKEFEIKPAKVLYMGKKNLDKVSLNNDTYVICTPDHKFLTKTETKLGTNYEYIENEKLTSNISIVPFKRNINKRGYWEIRNSNKRDEYRNIYAFYNKDVNLKGKDIHHIDKTKTNDSINNLKILTKKEHINEHRNDLKKDFTPSYPKDVIEKVLLENIDRCEAANLLNFTHDELYKSMIFYNIGSRGKRYNTEEQKQNISERMKVKNPYHNFTEDQKIFFAKHVGKDNGRWINVTNEELLRAGNDLYKIHNNLTSKIWINYAKENKLPQNPNIRFNTSFSNFSKLCIEYNHRIKTREFYGIDDCYTLQVEQNNNYCIITKDTINIQDGIVVKNCGDVMKLQIKVDENDKIIDTKIKVFGCASAISSSSFSSDIIKNKSLDEALKITNKEIATALSLPPVKMHCSMLAEDAIKAAINDYKNKKNKTNKCC